MAEFTKQPQLADFFREHPGQGSLRVQVSTGRGTFPVPGARVEVSRDMDSGRQIFYQAETDSSGIVQDITLPALELSDRAGGTVYQVWVEHPDYLPVMGQNIEIYPGVETLLPVALRPRLE